MKTPLYILGFLMRYGALHGYKLKQFIAERAADFARIKLPTIYYHLEKLQTNGFVTSEIEKAGRRPERFVFKITDSGRDYFKELLTEAINERFDIEFLIDAGLFFFEVLKPEEIHKALNERKKYLADSVKTIKLHRQEVLGIVPLEIKPAARAIFNHHLVHYEAELKWVKVTLADQKKS